MRRSVASASSLTSRIESSLSEAPLRGKGLARQRGPVAPRNKSGFGRGTSISRSLRQAITRSGDRRARGWAVEEPYLRRASGAMRVITPSAITGYRRRASATSGEMPTDLSFLGRSALRNLFVPFSGTCSFRSSHKRDCGVRVRRVGVVNTSPSRLRFLSPDGPSRGAHSFLVQVMLPAEIFWRRARCLLSITCALRPHCCLRRLAKRLPFVPDSNWSQLSVEPVSVSACQNLSGNV